jgi:YD repeat-containing protein
LVTLKQNNTTIATYTYDASNRRVSKTLLNENKTITYIYNHNQVVQEYENDSITNSYIYASYIDDPIAYRFNLKTYYYIKDRQYSVQAITDSLGNIVESYSYNSFGILTMKNQGGYIDENVGGLRTID